MASINYNFDISVQGGEAAAAQLPAKITAALGAVRSTPEATVEDEQLLMLLGQVINYYLGGVDENCFVDLHVNHTTMPTGETSISQVIRRRPFNPPVTADNPAWDPSQGPIVIKPADGVVAARAAAAPAQTSNAPKAPAVPRR